MGWTTRTGTALRNVHERTTAGPIDRAERLLANLGSPEDQVWPSDRWPRLVLDDGLAPGSRGGHGPIRYHVESADPREVRFRFDPGRPALHGWHAFRVAPLADGQVRWTHEFHLDRPSVLARHAVVPLHDGLLEDLLDQVVATTADRPLTRRPLPARLRFTLRALGLALRLDRSRGSVPT